jgi:hypothetical protein
MGTPKRWHTREDSGLVLDRHHQWWHDGERIEHPKIVEAFHQGLRVEPDGRYTLHFGNDWCFVTVEDTPFFVVSVDNDGNQVVLLLSDCRHEALDPFSLDVEPDGVISVRVKNGLAKARLSRLAQFQLVSLLSVETSTVVLKLLNTTVQTSLKADLFENDASSS